MSVDVRDAIDPEVLKDVFAWFGRVDGLFSTWRDDTEIVRLARGELIPAHVSSEVQIVLELCEALRADTGGAFDIAATARLPPPHPPGWCALDPSGLVKGWALEQAATVLAAAGATHLCINAGGDVVVRGQPGPDELWRVGIQHPWVHDRLTAVLAVSDVGVATSGRYQRGDHVIDPRTGRPADGVASATVVDPDLAMADAHATAIVALGHDALDWLETRTNIAAMVITDDHDVYVTRHFDRYRAASH